MAANQIVGMHLGLCGKQSRDYSNGKNFRIGRSRHCRLVDLTVVSGPIER